MSENMEEIVSRIMAENSQTNVEGQPVSEEDKIAIDNFKYGYNEGSYGEMCEEFGIHEKIDDCPVFEPTD